MTLQLAKTKDTIVAAERHYRKNGVGYRQVTYLTPFGKRGDGTTKYRSFTRHERA